MKQKKITLAILLLGLLWGSTFVEARSWQPYGTVYKKKYNVTTPTTIRLSGRCEYAYKVMIDTKAYIKRLTKSQCRRYKRKTRVHYPYFQVVSYRQQGSSCAVNLKVMTKGFCVYHEDLRGSATLNGSTFGHSSGRPPSNTVAFCRHYRRVTVMRQSVHRKYYKKVRAYCIRRGYEVVKSFRLGRVIWVKNFSRLPNRYICGAAFHMTFICTKGRGLY